MNENVENKAGDIVGDLVVNGDLEMNDAFTSIEQDFQADVGASDYNIHSDEQINVENQVKDVQAESIFADSSERKDTSMLSGQEFPGQRTLDNEGVNAINKATDANGDPSKDSDHTIDAENTTVDVPDPTLDSVEVNRVGEANDANKDRSTLSRHELPGQRTLDNEGVNAIDKATDVNCDPSKDSDHTIDAKTTTVDEPDPTLNSVEVNRVGEANDANGHPSQEFDVTIGVDNSNIDEADIIHDSSKN